MNSKNLNQHKNIVSSKEEITELNEDISSEDLGQYGDTILSKGEITEIVEDMLIDVTGGVGANQVIKAASRTIGKFNKSDFGSFLVPGAVGIGTGAGGFVIGQQIKKSRTSNNPTTPQV